MARLGSDSKLGHFPAGFDVVRTVAGLLDVGSRFSYSEDMAVAMNLLDVCAGDGRAVGYLGDLLEVSLAESAARARQETVFSLEVRTFGVELDGGRAALARKRLYKVLGADYFNTVMSEGFASLLWLNPPYGSDSGKRLERKFLMASVSSMRSFAPLVYLVPRYVLAHTAGFLSEKFETFKVWVQPDNPDAENYNQVILMARLASVRPYNAAENKALLESFARGQIEEIDQTGGNKYYLSPNAEPERFEALRYDFRKAERAIERYGFERSLPYRDMTCPPETLSVESLMALRSGHMVQLLASGITGKSGVPLSDYDTETGMGMDIIFRAFADKGVEMKVVGESDNPTYVVSERMKQTACILSLEDYTYKDDIDLTLFVYRWREHLADYMGKTMPTRYHPSLMERIDYSDLLRKPLPGNGQRLVIEGAVYAIKHLEDPAVVIVGEMGTGKTYMMTVAAYKAGKRRILVMGPPSMPWKWMDEIEATIRGAKVFVVARQPSAQFIDKRHPFYRLWRSPMEQLRWVEKHYGRGSGNEDVPVFVILAHSNAKQSYGRMPAVRWRWGYRPESRYDRSTGLRYDEQWQPFYQSIDPNGVEDEGGAETGVDAPGAEVVDIVSAIDAAVRGVSDDAGVDMTGLEAIDVDLSDVDLSDVELSDVGLADDDAAANDAASDAVEDVGEDEPEPDPAQIREMRLGRVVRRMCCPECGQPLSGKDSEPVSWNWLASGRRYCENLLVKGVSEESDAAGRGYYVAVSEKCGAPLWQAIGAGQQEGWVSPLGRRYASPKENAFLEYCYSEDRSAFEALCDREEGRGVGPFSRDYMPSAQTVARARVEKVFRNARLPPRRYDLAEFIKRELGGFFDFVVFDEVHQFSSTAKSAQANTASVLAEVIPQRGSLTGTYMSGYARPMFPMLYHYGNGSMRKDFSYGDKNRWTKLYGLIEKVIRPGDKSESSNSERNRNKRSSTRTYDLPGVMPGVLRYVLPSTLFIRLEDVVATLPPFNEWHIGVELDEEVSEETGQSQQSIYFAMETELLENIRALRWTDSRACQKLMSEFAHRAQVYPELCWREGVARVEHPYGGVIFDEQPLRKDKLYPKERKVLEIIEKEKGRDRPVGIFVGYTGKYDMIPRYQELLEEMGLKVAVLRTNTVHTDKRREWLDEQDRAGVDVLLCHPGTIMVGLDVLWVKTWIWLTPDYDTSRLRQASRRSWRVGQTDPIDVYFLTYTGTKQGKALYLISKKVQTALAVEGDVVGNGLAALSGADGARSIEQMLVDSDIDFGAVGSFEGKINIAGIEGDAEAEKLLVKDASEWDLAAFDVSVDDEVDEANEVTDEMGDVADEPELDADENLVVPPDIGVLLVADAPNDGDVVIDVPYRVVPDEAVQDGDVAEGPIVEVGERDGLVRMKDDIVEGDNSYGGVKMDSFMSAWGDAFGLVEEDFKPDAFVRGRPKRKARKE